jgi:hypothetical protein
MADGYTLTVRTGPKVERERFAELSGALDALESRLAPLEGRQLRDAVDLRYREFSPVAQVAVRGEVSGPRRLFGAVRGGVDLRGDGSAEAYTGRVRRRLVKQRKGESAFAALRRELSSDSR